jgi:hypothetical protein
LQSLCRNGDHGFTRNTLHTFLIRIYDLRRYPQHAPQPLPFIFHEVLSTLRFVDITHYMVSATTSNAIPGLTSASPLVCAAQMRPQQSPTDSFPQRPQPPPPRSSDMIRCELCLEKYTFNSHNAAWCPILHADNIREGEVKERVL